MIHGDYEALKILALKSRVKPDLNDLHRFVARWYSKEFFTPLHIVYTLPVEELWQTYYEEMFANMEQVDLEQEIELALESPQEREKRLAREKDESASEDAFLALAEAANAASKAKSASDAMIEQLAKTKLPVMGEEPPDIDINFVSPQELDDIISGKSVR